jgi:hypothetical protein
MFISEKNFNLICKLAVQWEVEKLKVRCLEHPLIFTTEKRMIFGLRVATESKRKDIISGRNSESSFLLFCLVEINGKKTILLRHLILS